MIITLYLIKTVVTWNINGNQLINLSGVYLLNHIIMGLMLIFRSNFQRTKKKKILTCLLKKRDRSLSFFHCILLSEICGHIPIMCIYLCVCVHAIYKLYVWTKMYVIKWIYKIEVLKGWDKELLLFSSLPHKLYIACSSSETTDLKNHFTVA